jgi:L-asparaginase / beta-aspartyl-peptidase
MGWTIAIHGGAGTIQRGMPLDEVEAIKRSLAACLKRGMDVLAVGGRALDAVQTAVMALEDDEHFNAGRGAVLTRDGEHELDATLMDGRDLACGAIGGARTPKNPIVLARAVMERTPHVLLVAEGADALAREAGLELVSQGYFTTARRKAQWERFRALAPGALSLSEDDEGPKGTVGAVALDQAGDLAAATSTGGLTNKRAGRVGDTGCIGAGTYACNRTCAVSTTGHGEQFMRHLAAFAVHARMELAGSALEDAARAVIYDVLQPGDGGLVAVDAAGRVAMPYSSMGMYRAAADHEGRFEVHIWEARA